MILHCPKKLWNRQIAGNGIDTLPELIRAMINTAMQIERQSYLKAGLYERNEERQGHANGYKDKAVRMRVGAITFAMPQVRGERALTLTLAETYIQRPPRAKWLPFWSGCAESASPPVRLAR